MVGWRGLETVRVPQGRRGHGHERGQARPGSAFLSGQPAPARHDPEGDRFLVVGDVLDWGRALHINPTTSGGDMPAMTEPRELFIYELEDIYYVEQLLVKTLPKLAGEAK